MLSVLHPATSRHLSRSLFLILFLLGFVPTSFAQALSNR